ncbi:MAG TPA: hypothetical protein VIM84_02610 [Gemmatimonadales bacterium]
MDEERPVEVTDQNLKEWEATILYQIEQRGGRKTFGEEWTLLLIAEVRRLRARVTELLEHEI